MSLNELKMAQELIASMLGVRREGVTEAAGKIQADGLIQYGRGKITVLDHRVAINMSRPITVLRPPSRNAALS